MIQDPKSEIQRIKSELKLAEQAFQRWSSLEQKREELEQTISNLKEQVESSLLEMHQKQTRDPEVSAKLSHWIEQQNQQLILLKLKKNELDALLDTLEESSEEK